MFGRLRKVLKFETSCFDCLLLRHAESYREKRVVIVGFGNTACDAAVDLSSVCSQVPVM